MESTFISVLVQGGAVGVALAALYIVYQQNKNVGQMYTSLTNTLEKIAEDHRTTIDRNTDAWTDNTKALAELRETLLNRQH